MSSNKPIAMRLQFPHHGIEFLIAAQFGIQTRRVCDVIAMRASPLGLQKRRWVDIGDAQAVEVRYEVFRIGEAKLLIETAGDRSRLGFVFLSSADSKAKSVSQ